MNIKKNKKVSPSMDNWLKEAKSEQKAIQQGMILVHNVTVRQTTKAKVRYGHDDGSIVKAMEFSYDKEKVDQAIEKTYKMVGIFRLQNKN